MSRDNQNNAEKESIGKEIRNTVSSGDGGTLTRTFLAYAFDRQKIVDAILMQEWHGLTKPIKYFLAMFGILAASMAIFGEPTEGTDMGKIGKVIDAMKPYIWLLAITGPYSILMHYFMGSHGRRLSDTIRVICYSSGTFFVVGAAMAPFMESTRQWPMYVLAPIAVYLLIVRPYQIVHLTHNVGFGRYFLALVFANTLGIIPAFLIFGAIAFILGSLGFLPPEQP